MPRPARSSPRRGAGDRRSRSAIAPSPGRARRARRRRAAGRAHRRAVATSWSHLHGRVRAILSAWSARCWRAPRADATTPPDLSSIGTARARRRTAASLGRVGVSIAAAARAARRQRLHRPRARAPVARRRACNIEVTGHQWWWEVALPTATSRRDIFTTANELHVPVGRPVVVTLKADDVIHSFWVPNLARQEGPDPRPHARRMQFRADQPGIYRGQCAEFCGYQHALHGVRRRSPIRRRSTRPGPQRSASPRRAGRRDRRSAASELFLRQHLRDVPRDRRARRAGAQHGARPHARRAAADARRRHAAEHAATTSRAGSPTRSSIKPGANMPAHAAARTTTCDALVAYLESLK